MIKFKSFWDSERSFLFEADFQINGFKIDTRQLQLGLSVKV